MHQTFLSRAVQQFDIQSSGSNGSRSFVFDKSFGMGDSMQNCAQNEQHTGMQSGVRHHGNLNVMGHQNVMCDQNISFSRQNSQMQSPQ